VNIREQIISPYVISQDIGRLVTNWGVSSGNSVPEKSYFKGMTCELETVLNQIFPKVEIIDEEYLSKGMQSLVENSDLPVVSLDRCYIQPNTKNVYGFLDVSRCVDENFNKFGLSGRNTQNIDSQMDELCQKLKGVDRIAIIDDVLFEGATHKQVAALFKARGIKLEEVLTGIAIGDGIKNLENEGIKVKSLIIYKSVIDEICERDFTAGVPFSGRTVIAKDNSVYGAPYFEPFGNPIDWASIPEDKVKELSGYCIESSIYLWKNIERRSQKSISTEEVPKRVFGLEKNNSVVSALSNIKYRD